MEQHFVGGAFFNDAPGVHHRYAIRDGGDDSQIMRDEEQAEIHFAAQSIQQFEDLFLNGDVESGGGLVGNEELRSCGEGHGDHGTLT
jgi:hypothetical protein